MAQADSFTVECKECAKVKPAEQYVIFKFTISHVYGRNQGPHLLATLTLQFCRHD